MKRLLQVFAVLALVSPLFSQETEGTRTVRIMVDGVPREALVFFPPKGGQKSPVVFAFHGHGGSMNNAMRSFAIQKHWPQAIAVYMQGLKTPGKLTDPEGKKSGWQHSKGDQGDRDLKFFDAMLDHIRKEAKVDEERIYSTGHSNGGGFTYLLWQNRGDVFAAVAPSASAALRMETALSPKPCLHFAGDMDPLVKFDWQKKTMEIVKKINGCEEKGSEWDKHCTLYASSKGAPLIACVYPGGHQFAPFAPELMVKFFKMHSKPRLAK